MGSCGCSKFRHPGRFRGAGEVNITVVLVGKLLGRQRGGFLRTETAADEFVGGTVTLAET